MKYHAQSISNKLHGIERRLCALSVLLVLTFFSMYIYFVGKSIINVVVREETEIRIAEVNSGLSELELSYLDKKNDINLQFAREKGFHAISKKDFVSRGVLVGRSFSFNNEL